MRGAARVTAYEILHRYEEDSNGCWIWAGRRNTKGYGIFTAVVNDENVAHMAHRFYYEQYRGDIPPGLQMDHLCRRRGCVNPWHLEPVTCKENINRGARCNPHLRERKLV